MRRGNIMGFVRVNISLPEELLEKLSGEIMPRKRSRFIAESIQRSLTERKRQKLAEEYREAAKEIRRINHELETVIGDGLD